MKLQRRIYGANLALQHFIRTHWVFENDCFLKLHNDIKQSDLKSFRYDNFVTADVREYFLDCMLGARRYLLHEKDEDLPRARRNYRRWVRVKTIHCIKLNLQFRTLNFVLVLFYNLQKTSVEYAKSTTVIESDKIETMKCFVCVSSFFGSSLTTNYYDHKRLSLKMFIDFTMVLSSERTEQLILTVHTDNLMYCSNVTTTAFALHNLFRQFSLWKPELLVGPEKSNTKLLLTSNLKFCFFLFFVSEWTSSIKW